MIRKDPASRGTEELADVLVVTCRNAGPLVRRQSAHSRRRPKGPLHPVTAMPPPIRLHTIRHWKASGERAGYCTLGNLVRPESHPEPRGLPVQSRLTDAGRGSGDQVPGGGQSYTYSCIVRCVQLYIYISFVQV